MNDEEYEDFKNYTLNIKGLDCLDEKMLGMLIDSLVEFYIDKYGIDSLADSEPEKPDFQVENLNIANDYLKKFKLQ
jgi:hypothetical protein